MKKVLIAVFMVIGISCYGQVPVKISELPKATMVNFDSSSIPIVEGVGSKVTRRVQGYQLKSIFGSGGSVNAIDSLRSVGGYVEGLKNGSWIQQYEIPVPETPEVGDPYNGISGSLSDGFKLGGDLNEDTYLNIQGNNRFEVIAKYDAYNETKLSITDNFLGLTMDNGNSGFSVFDNTINLGYYNVKRITLDKYDNYAFSVECDVDGYTFPIQSPLENETLVADGNRNLKWQKIQKEYTAMLSIVGTTIYADVLKNNTGVTFSWGTVDGAKLPFTASAAIDGNYVFMQNNIQRVQPGSTPTIFYLGDNPSAIFNGLSGELQTLNSSGVPDTITFSNVLVQFFFYE